MPQLTDYRAEYETGWNIVDIFQTGAVGIVTARDRLTLHWTPDDVRETVENFVSLSVNAARERYRLPRDSQDWQIHRAQADLRDHPSIEQHIAPFTIGLMTHVGRIIQGGHLDFTDVRVLK